MHDGQMQAVQMEVLQVYIKYIKTQLYAFWFFFKIIFIFILLYVKKHLKCKFPDVGEAVFARCLSSLKDERVAASKQIAGPESSKYTGDKKAFIEDIRKVSCAN